MQLRQLQKGAALTQRLVVSIAFGLCLIVGASLEPAFPLREVIPKGSVQVDVMQLALPRRAVELGQKLQANVMQHPDWWSEQVQNVPEGEAVPYDPRMDITEAEYADFLELASAGTLVKVGEATLDFQWLGSRRVRLRAEGELAGAQRDRNRCRFTACGDSNGIPLRAR